MKRTSLLPMLLVTIATTLFAAACGSSSSGGGDGGGGSGGGCTEVGCEDGLTIAFSLHEPGMYTFDLVSDGQAITCSATLPLPPCSTGGASNCSVSGVFVGESGCALAPAAQSLEDIMFYLSTPASVELTVRRDGVEIAHQTFAPTYKTVSPNGPDCGPTCDVGSVSLAVP